MATVAEVKLFLKSHAILNTIVPKDVDDINNLDDLCEEAHAPPLLKMTSKSAEHAHRKKFVVNVHVNNKEAVKARYSSVKEPRHKLLMQADRAQGVWDTDNDITSLSTPAFKTAQGKEAIGVLEVEKDPRTHELTKVGIAGHCKPFFLDRAGIVSGSHISQQELLSCSKLIIKTGMAFVLHLGETRDSPATTKFRFTQVMEKIASSAQKKADIKVYIKGAPPIPKLFTSE
jgi:hypothetical protein